MLDSVDQCRWQSPVRMDSSWCTMNHYAQTNFKTLKSK